MFYDEVIPKPLVAGARPGCLIMQWLSPIVHKKVLKLFATADTPNTRLYTNYKSVMPLCAICDNLDLYNLTDSDNDLQDVPHHKSLPSLKQSALTCPLCDLFFKGLSADQPIMRTEDHKLENSPVFLRGWQNLDDESNQGGIYVLKVRCDRARARALFGMYTDEGCYCATIYMSISYQLIIR